jgi:hypothetical protein
MGILKIVDHVAHARKLRYHPLSVLRDSLRRHVARQRYHPAIGLHMDGSRSQSYGMQTHLKASN